MLNKLMPLVLFSVLMFFGLWVSGITTSVDSESNKETSIPQTMLVPVGAKLVGFECGSPCIVYWDSEFSRYVIKFADDRIMYITSEGSNE